MRSKKSGQIKLTYLVTQDWYFVSHRKSLASAAIEAGFDVSLITQVDKFANEIRGIGVSLYEIHFYRALGNILNEFRTINTIREIYHTVNTDIIHQVSLKACLYGSVAIYFLRKKHPDIKSINAFTGLGYLFTSNSTSARIIRVLLRPLMKRIFNQPGMLCIFQNASDRDLFLRHKIVYKSNSVLVPGSGVELDKFHPVQKPDKSITVALVARMLIEKGVYEFVSAAEQLKQQYSMVKFVLVGDTDVENPSGISQEQLDEWHKTGVVESWGRQDNMPSIYAQCDIVVLPSYREGLPKVLLEAQACEIPVVTTDVPGCRDAIIPDETGLLVPVRNPEALANAIEKLLSDKELRHKMGKRGRELVVEKFSSLVINSQFINIYNDILTAG